MELAVMEDETAALAVRLVEGLAGLDADDVESDLTVTFGLSAWLGQARSDAGAAVEALLLARTLVLDVGVLNREQEPVPLVARQADAAVLALARYLHGLLERAARAAGMARATFAAGLLDLAQR